MVAAAVPLDIRCNPTVPAAVCTAWYAAEFSPLTAASDSTPLSSDCESPRLSRMILIFSDRAIFVLLSVDFFPDLCYNVDGLLCPVGNPRVTNTL